MRPSRALSTTILLTMVMQTQALRMLPPLIGAFPDNSGTGGKIVVFPASMQHRHEVDGYHWSGRR
jgi:hypothetical protein